MVGKDIPLETVYISGSKGIRTEKRPQYILKTAEEEKAHQERLGKSVGFWYGTKCEKCCGVYPKFFTTLGFENLGYYVCMVCGKESKHCDMNWQARDAWNAHEYHFKPETYQYTIFDYIEG
jgi:hypothetical protein